jgi:hypothetical protein
VTAKEEQRGLLRTTFSQAEGQYQIDDLAPGTYEIAIAFPSFATSVQVQTLQVGDDRRLNIVLRPGLVEERIEVKGEASALNVTDSQLGGNVSRVQVDNLPLNGRNFLELARLERAGK